MEKNITFKRQLPLPEDIKEMMPVSKDVAEIRAAKIEEMQAILRGENNRLMLIIGPCSADSEAPVLDYMGRIAKVQEQVKDKILIVPRVYTNKPRTNGDGYKGMLHQPDPDKKSDMLEGLMAIRKLHIDAIKVSGLACADEMLYPENYRYLSDVLGYVAVGARSVEDQFHRLVSSAIDVPVGMKNPTSGDISVMMNSIHASRGSHTFLYRGWEVESKGNPYTHAVLRGYVDSKGQNFPNYHYENLIDLCGKFSEANITNPACIVDCNHSNSGKQYIEQIRIAKEILHSKNHSEDINKLVKGLMIESYIEDGKQSVGGGCYGKSITDPCLGWDKTETLILELAEQVK